MMPSLSDLREMIELAMQERAPNLYRSLKASGALQDEVRRRAEQAQETFLTMAGTERKQDVLARQEKPYLTQLQERTIALKTAAEVAVTQAIEFPSESPRD